MSRKTSLYMRKRRTLLDDHGGISKKHPMAVLRECRPFNDDDGTSANAADAMNLVNSAFVRIADGVSDNVDDFDYLAHAVGVAEVRAVEIAGHEDDQMMPLIRAGNDALARCKARYLKWHKMELPKADAAAVRDALDVYEVILQASSPRQMADACEVRIRVLREVAA